MVSVILSLDAGAEDLQIRQQQGVIGLRRHRLERIANEAFQQGGLLTVEDIANRLLNWRENPQQGFGLFERAKHCFTLRSIIKDMGRAISHRTLIIKEWLLVLLYQIEKRDGLFCYMAKY